MMKIGGKEFVQIQKFMVVTRTSVSMTKMIILLVGQHDDYRINTGVFVLDQNVAKMSTCHIV
jgi:hypothetical protein